jgi:cysteinyl-tRNA synthetase
VSRYPHNRPEPSISGAPSAQPNAHDDLTRLRLFNTLARRIEVVEPREPGFVRMYSCGPTVYRYVHIGNLRTYLMADWIRRTLEADGRTTVRMIQNITDVGHMRQDVVDRGEDKMIAAALAEGKTPGEIAAFYTAAFMDDIALMGIRPATVYPRATDHVPQMIALIERLLAGGHAYRAGANVYFDVATFPAYGRLSGNRDTEALREAVRVEADPLKRHPQDFALWKGAEPGRLVKWESPWGAGFPGWHIECSAMAIAHLGEQLDLHTGGVDNIFPHHEDEIAQSEAATGRLFTRHWVHAQHLLADGTKMAKSAGNAYTLSDLLARGFSASDFRYLCLTVHYRHRLNFTFASLRAARHGLNRLRDRIWQLTRDADKARNGGDDKSDEASDDPGAGRAKEWQTRFWTAVHEDLGLPAALATCWRMLGDERLSAAQKLALTGAWDALLGLDLLATARAWIEESGGSKDAQALLRRREAAREQRDYAYADVLRKKLHALGYDARDTPAGPRLRPTLAADTLAGAISSPEQVASFLAEPDSVEFSVLVYSTFWPDDLRRCIESVLRHSANDSIEIIMVDAGVSDEALAWLSERARADGGDERIRLVRADHVLGEAEARNIALRQSRGMYCVVLDTSVELAGDVWGALRAALQEPRVVVAGPYGLVTRDLRQFEEATGVDGGDGLNRHDVDAIEGYLMAFPRAAVRRVGLMDVRYRFYRNLDLDYSFTLRQKGVKDAATDPDRAVAVALPVVRHEHRMWESLDEEERAKRSKRNFDVFLRKWHHHTHLMIQRPSL